MDRATSASLFAVSTLLALTIVFVSDVASPASFGDFAGLGLFIFFSCAVLSVGFGLHALVFYKPLNKGEKERSSTRGSPGEAEPPTAK